MRFFDKVFWIGIVIVASGVILGCDKGRVVDGEDGSLLEDAELSFFEWPPPSVAGSEMAPWYWPSNPLFIDEDYFLLTTDETDSFDGYNWAVSPSVQEENPASRCAYDDALLDDSFERNRWYRVKVERGGYDPSFYYRYHSGHFEDDDCVVYDCVENEWVEGKCHVFDDFEMWPESGSDYARLPDIFVEPRALKTNHIQCAKVPGDDSIRAAGIRMSIATPNVGSGDFRIEYDLGQEEIRQRIDLSDGGFEYKDLDEVEIAYDSDHGHYHLIDWVGIHLLHGDTQCDVHPDERTEECLLSEGSKLGFCLSDVRKFDDEIIQEYPSPSGGYGSTENNRACQLMNGHVVMGISPGKSEVYHDTYGGQFLSLGDPQGPNVVDAGDYWLEVQWDPEGLFEYQRDNSNTATRVRVKIPSLYGVSEQELETECSQGIAGVQDCRNFPDTDSLPAGTVDGYCEDFLRCNDDSDCPDWLSCESVSDPEGRFCIQAAP